MSDTMPDQSKTVSIVTVTQYSRRECLVNLAMLIKSQLYTNIVEWVIVEGSRYSADADANSYHITNIQDAMMHKLRVLYVPFEMKQCLSDRRNKGNQLCNGDIIVCMDDDDYYPPNRVSHAVYMLNNSTSLIAGCSPVYIYFYLTRQFFKFKSYGTNHSTNNCMAYKRAYLETHAYEGGLDKSEESSFTNGFTEPMVQLDPMKTIVVSGHGSNTVDKRGFVEQNSKMIISLNDDSIMDYIPLAIILKMEVIFKNVRDCKY